MNQIMWLNLGKGLIFKMVEEFDDVFDDDITTLTHGKSMGKSRETY